MSHLRRALALGLGVAVLAGCEPTSTAPTTTAAPTTSTAVHEACADAAASIVTAVDDLLAAYEEPAETTTATPADSLTPSPPEAATSDSTATATETADASTPLAEAVASARKVRDRCDEAAFDQQVEEGLAAIEPTNPIAVAVWRRVSATLLGEAEQVAGEIELAPGDDLASAVARAAEGSTIVLPAGTLELEGTLVLLNGVTLRGQGRDATTLHSAASDAAIIVVAEGLVQLADLTLELSGDHPASGLVAGPSASVALTGVRVAGATKSDGGAGGAGVYLSAQGVEGSGRGTTMEVTDSAFERNEWAGVAVAGGHRVSIESTAFTGNGEVGILFLDAASGSVANSAFADNAVGLAATGTATPTWVASTVTGGTVGAQLDGTAAPVIEGLRITGSMSAAVVFGGGSAGVIGTTTCKDVPYGIVVADTAAPTLGENDCSVARSGS